MARINNKLYVRGRFVRDPNVVDAKDNSGRKFVFGRIAVDQPYIDGNGDTKSSTSYFEIKAFDDTCAQALIGGGARQGTLIEATGTAKLETSEYEKDGEKRVSYAMVVVLDDKEHHNVLIEAQPRGET
jgi:single-stranded DNA-binding protein